MSEARPNAICLCGYPLLPGQDCPECGRAYTLARATGPEPLAYLVWTIVGVGMLFAPLYLFTPLAALGRWVGLLTILVALLSGVPAAKGLVLAVLAWPKSRGHSMIVMAVVMNAVVIVLWMCVVANLARLTP